MKGRTLALALVGVLCVGMGAVAAQPAAKSGDGVSTVVVETAHIVRATAEGETYIVNLDNVSFVRFDTVNKKLTVQFVNKTELQLDGAKASAVYDAIEKQSYVSAERN